MSFLLFETAGALNALEHLPLAGAVARNGADQVILPAVHGGVRPPVVSGIGRRSRGYCRGLTGPWMSGTLLRGRIFVHDQNLMGFQSFQYIDRVPRLSDDFP